MIKIHGLNDNSSEYNSAQKLAQIAITDIPEIKENNNIILEIFPSVQCFGQQTQDIDLLVFFADFRDESFYSVTDNNIQIQSFCTSIEVKNHSPESVTFEGSKCIVMYNKSPHDVTSQSEQQKYSVMNYIKKNNYKGTSPYINNLIWLRHVPNSVAPKVQSNILTSEITWFDFLNKISLLSGNNSKKIIATFSSRFYLNEILQIFAKKIEITNIDRKKLETLTKSILDRDQQQYVNKIGHQLLIFRGRGGTGKTIRLLRIAYQIYNEMGLRILLLTYNKALVADIRRLLSILHVKDAVAEGSIVIKTIHQFMHQWLTQLEVVSKKQDDFLDNYEQHKINALKYIDTGTLSSDDIENARKTASRNLAWDLIMIDESQDWPSTERDLIYKLYTYKKIIIADGVDQLVRGVKRIDWRENIDTSETQIVSLRKSLRLKYSLCQTVGYFANEMEYSDWNLQPLPETYGGRVIIIYGNAMSEEFHRKLTATAKKDGNSPVDMLFCVPPSWVLTDSQGCKYSKIAKQYQFWGKKVWDGVDPDIRGDYPTELDQYRIVQYESCRGLEGWIVVNFALDEFFEFKKLNSEILKEKQEDSFFSNEYSALDYAKKWTMIPLTRAIDTLVIHISNPRSYIGQALKDLQEKYPENIEHHNFY